MSSTSFGHYSVYCAHTYSDVWGPNISYCPLILCRSAGVVYLIMGNRNSAPKEEEKPPQSDEVRVKDAPVEGGEPPQHKEEHSESQVMG